VTGVYSPLDRGQFVGKFILQIENPRYAVKDEALGLKRGLKRGQATYLEVAKAENS